MAGGLRARRGQGEIGRPSRRCGGGPDAAAAPGRRDLGGPDPRRRRPRATSSGCSRPRAIRSTRFARLDAARRHGHARGSIDPHTHLLFAGIREGELELRQQGAGYLEILAAGGGILSTVAATRAASADELAAHGRRWLDEMLGHGVTTIEAKSGYGLDLPTELRLLEVAHQLGAEGPDRGRPDVARRPRRPAGAPRPAGRDRGLRPLPHRGAAARRRRPGPGAFRPTSSASRASSPPTSRGGS